MKTVKIIPGRIDQLLKERKFNSKNEFCKRFNIDPATLKKAREGGPIRPDILKRLAEAFGLPESHLSAEENQHPSPVQGRHVNYGTVIFDTVNDENEGWESIISLSKLKLDDLDEIAMSEKIRWRVLLSEIDEEEQNQIECIEEGFENLKATVTRLDEEENKDSLKYQLDQIQNKRNLEDMLSHLDRMGIALHYAHYFEFVDQGEHQECAKVDVYESKLIAVIVVSKKRAAIERAQVSLGDLPPKYKSARDIMINGQIVDLPEYAFGKDPPEDAPF
jgi:hypothetical protein